MVNKKEEVNVGKRCETCNGSLRFFGDFRKDESEYYEENMDFDYVSYYICENCDEWYELFSRRN